MERLQSPRQSSGRYLIGVLLARSEQNEDAAVRYRLGFDVYIKHQSYVFINRVFLGIAMFSSLCAILWPLIVVVGDVYDNRFQPVIKAAVTQTCVTGLAALTVYIYQTYKKRQTAAENILRIIAFGTMPLDRLASTVADEISRLDQGMLFTPVKHVSEDEHSADTGKADRRK